MIERQFIAQNMKEYLIQEYIATNLKNVGFSHAKLVKTPAGMKVIIFASRPGLIVGKRGANIRELTEIMRVKFKLENPQIEIAEVENPDLDPHIVAERIVSSMERFGTQRFKGIGHKAISDVMKAGARGIEIIVSGKIPSARAKSWRFYSGNINKSGDIAVSGVKDAIAAANLKSGTVGVKVSIMPPDVKRPDDIAILERPRMDQLEAQAAEEKKALEEKKSKRKPRSEKSGEEKQKRTRKSKETANKTEAGGHQ